MSVNDTSMIVIDDCRVSLQIVASSTDDSRGIIYNCNMFMVQVAGNVLLYCSQVLDKTDNNFMCKHHS